jgi:hypothetical protein
MSFTPNAVKIDSSELLCVKIAPGNAKWPDKVYRALDAFV